MSTQDTKALVPSTRLTLLLTPSPDRIQNVTSRVPQHLSCVDVWWACVRNPLSDGASLPGLERLLRPQSHDAPPALPVLGSLVCSCVLFFAPALFLPFFFPSIVLSTLPRFPLHSLLRPRPSLPFVPSWVAVGWGSGFELAAADGPGVASGDHRTLSTFVSWFGKTIQGHCSGVSNSIASPCRSHVGSGCANK